jgi:hypothetical protein
VLRPGASGGAQHARALRAGPVPPALALGPAARELLRRQPRVRRPAPSAWRYVATGALVGGAVAAAVIGVAYAQARDTECMTCVLFIPPVLVGALRSVRETATWCNRSAFGSHAPHGGPHAS